MHSWHAVSCFLKHCSYTICSSQTNLNYWVSSIHTPYSTSPCNRSTSRSISYSRRRQAWRITAEYAYPAINFACCKSPTRHSTTDSACLYWHVLLLYVNLLLQVLLDAAQHKSCSTTHPNVSGMHTCTAGNLPRLVAPCHCSTRTP
jgi:hypothetical protein